MSTLATGAADVAHKVATTTEQGRAQRINATLYALEVKLAQLRASGAPMTDHLAAFAVCEQTLTEIGVGQ